MARMPGIHKHTIPDAFRTYRQGAFERTVRLTEAAIGQLEAEGRQVTLASVCEITRMLDERNKGLRAAAILRNPRAAELFRQHSPAYQERQQKARKAKQKRAQAKPQPNAQATYQGLHVADLIPIVEELKAQVGTLKVQQKELQNQRNEAYRVRDEALQQNARLVAALTTQVQRCPNQKQ
jgi:hypothetical protein